MKDKQSFLATIETSYSSYLENALKVKAAANRLITKYHLQEFDSNQNCSACKIEDDNKKIETLKNNIKFFRENKQAYLNYRKALLTTNINQSLSTRYTKDTASVTTLSTSDTCCGWGFYACCTLCAATIEAFPAYLLCCGFCYDQYCCKPPAVSFPIFRATQN